MATSRRRERELARRRFERRRQAELERRARAKRRNTVVGAVIGTVAVIVVLVVIGISVFGGSSKKTPAAKTKVTPSASTTASPAADTPAPKRCKKIAPNPPLKGAPHVPDVTGKAPTTKLVTKTVKTGHGPAAKNGDNLNVLYTGVSCATGKEFDSSYKATPATPLPVKNLGSGGLIPGFATGLVGMKAGGVRELVIPGPLAYASEPSSAPTFPNDTLIFLVKVTSITPGK